MSAGHPNRRQLLAALAALPACASPPAPPTAPPTAPTFGTDPRPLNLQLPEPADARLPSLFLIGDSTVRNGRDDGQGLGPAGQWGWGRVLAEYLDPSRINVVNRAIGGLSSRTYRSGGHWDRTRAFIRRGDTVLIQFGHNDSSPVNDTQRARGTLKGIGSDSEVITNLLTGQRETVFSYGAYLRGYIADIRALGATPVLCSPVPRKRWDAQGRTVRTRASYAGWADSVAHDSGVALLDLDAWIAERYDALGPDIVHTLFTRTQPEDNTHTNWAGAALNAQTVAAGLQQRGVLPDAVYTRRYALTDSRPVAAGLNPRLPTVFVIGDSTVRSGGQGGFWGWGERLDTHLDPARVNLANHAIGGRSTRTYTNEGRWDAVAAQLRPGDVVLMQFGHNDGGRIGDPLMKNRASGPGTGPEVVADTRPDGTPENVHSFGWYLSRFVRDARRAGAVPVVLSPVPHQDRWAEGRDFENFAAWGREVAAREGGYFIDLTMLVTEAYRAAGAERVAGYFADARTHTNDAGARLNAACVARGLAQLPGGLLLAWLRQTT